MIEISGYWRTVLKKMGTQDDSEPLVINCCGYQKFITKNLFVNRKSGRLDYQLIYISQGSGFFLLNGESKKLSEGELILFRPHEQQVYSYYYEDNPIVYWIHFTGNNVDSLLETFQIRSGYIGNHASIIKLLSKIITELQLKKSGYKMVIDSYFQILLATIYRCKNDILSNDRNSKLMDSLIIQLNERYQQNWTVKEMAQFCNLSEGYFAHYFKESTGYAPMQYLTNLRISRAKYYLVETDMSLSSIAPLVGYKDPLYFSRVFKKTTGLAPRDYQKNYGSVEHPGTESPARWESF